MSAVDAPQKIDWDEQEFAEVRPGIFGATVHTPQLTAAPYRYGAGSSWVIDFVVDGEPVQLSAGQLATLPGGTPHSATVGDAPAVSLNVFTHRDATLRGPSDG